MIMVVTRFLAIPVIIVRVYLLHFNTNITTASESLSIVRKSADLCNIPKERT
jgi:hypothetical protein